MPEQGPPYVARGARDARNRPGPLIARQPLKLPFDAELHVGNSGNDVLQGGNGPDILLGYAGDDLLRGGNGIDYLNGGAGNDYMDGGADDDRSRERAIPDT
mgnify:CR=1 FL=1